MVSFALFFLNMLSLLLLVSLLVVIWAVRNKQGVKQLSWVIIFMIIWSIGSFMETISRTHEAKLFWRNVTQVGVFLSPVATLMFAILFTGYGNSLRKKLARVLYLVQGFGVLLIFTDRTFHFMRSSVELSSQASDAVIVVYSTYLGLFFISLNFLLLIFSFVMMAIHVTKLAHGMRTQVYAVLIGLAIPIIYGLAKMLNPGTFTVVPISSIFVFSSILLMVGIIRFDLLKIAPLAREQVFHSLGDGVVIMSKDGRVIDANPAALKMFGPTFQAINDELAPYLDASPKKDGSPCHFTLGEAHFRLDSYPVVSANSQSLGSVALIKDITVQKIQNDLLSFRAERDGLTALFNRQTFIERVTKHENLPVKGVHLLYLDLDHFKAINDEYGHTVGDSVLRQFGALLAARQQEGDLTARMGGEEFALFRTGCSAEEMHAWAKSFCSTVAAYSFTHEELRIPLTISIGVASSAELAFEQLYKLADTMLYKAKQDGRNCVRSTILDAV